MMSRPGPSIVLNLPPRHGNRSRLRIQGMRCGRTCRHLPSNHHQTLPKPHAYSLSLGGRESSRGPRLWSGLVQLLDCLIGKAITVIIRGRNRSGMISITSILALSMTMEETRNQMRITKPSLHSIASGERGLIARRVICRRTDRRPRERVPGRRVRGTTTRRR